MDGSNFDEELLVLLQPEQPEQAVQPLQLVLQAPLQSLLLYSSSRPISGNIHLPLTLIWDGFLMSPNKVLISEIIPLTSSNERNSALSLVLDDIADLRIL